VEQLCNPTNGLLIELLGMLILHPGCMIFVSASHNHELEVDSTLSQIPNLGKTENAWFIKHFSKMFWISLVGFDACDIVPVHVVYCLLYSCCLVLCVGPPAWRVNSRAWNDSVCFGSAISSYSTTPTHPHTHTHPRTLISSGSEPKYCRMIESGF
jgi:hypothetical protein